jgi:hypothetical protein
VPLFDGAAGVIGCGDDDPEPVVLGGVAVRAGVLAVVDVEEPLLAVLLLLCEPAMITKPISSSNAIPNPTFRRRSRNGGPPGRSNADHP